MILEVIDYRYNQEFETQLIKNMVVKSRYVKKVVDDKNCTVYALVKRDIADMLPPFEAAEQEYEKKKPYNQCTASIYRELIMMAGLLRVVRDDDVLHDEEEAILFVIKADEEVIEKDANVDLGNSI